jgi:hypothetical protein
MLCWPRLGLKTVSGFPPFLYFEKSFLYSYISEISSYNSYISVSVQNIYFYFITLAYSFNVSLVWCVSYI